MFKVGDLVVCNKSGEYSITHENVVCVVNSFDPEMGINNLNVSLFSYLDGGEIYKYNGIKWWVHDGHFSLYNPKPKRTHKPAWW